jgi:hypothetical protein
MIMHTDRIADVFAHWKAIMGHERARMDVKRAQAIRDRLRDGYSVDDLMLAIEGCASSAFHMGENDRRQVYDSVTLILRDADHTDKFIQMGELARKKIAAMQERQAETGPRTVPTDEEKARVRELLKSVRLKRVA